ncbi:MAG: glycosyltransferase [Ruminococcaceae bacterium]|nr:glycosyltransferase [Oscillospiraceae bacterium]
MPEPGAKKRILYLLDDVNYPSGVRNATALQARALQGRFDVSALSLHPAGPEARALFAGIPFVDTSALQPLNSLHHPLGQVLVGRGYTLGQRLLKLRQARAIIAQRQEAFNLKLFGGPLLPVMDNYDIVVVASEASMFRPLAAQLKKARKVQWIHTDYARWKNYTLWARRMTRHDASLYAGFDAVVTLSALCRDGFLALYPALAGKTHSIRNLVAEDTIRQKAGAGLAQSTALAPFNLITIGRLEAEKNLDALLDTAGRLAREGHAYHWYLVGDGRLAQHVRKRIQAEGLADKVILTGQMDNPYPLLAACDVMVLLSRYEGTPVTIDEAGVLGVPVVATQVGGIPDQICDGQTGRLLPLGNDLAQRAAAVLAGMIKDPHQLRAFRQNMAGAGPQNQATLARLEDLFSAL